jgi:hypothetical protein
MYTLLHAGVPQNDPTFIAGMKCILEKPLEKTYNVALTAMFLEAVDAVRYQRKLMNCAQFLVDNQCLNGQWEYGKPVPLPQDTPGGGDVTSGSGGSGSSSGGNTVSVRSGKKVPVKRRTRGPEHGDNSNTQFALLGLRACYEGGIDIPVETWKDAQGHFTKTQNPDGGYGYTAWTSGNTKCEGSSYGSMTCASVCSLIIAMHYQKLNWKKDPGVLSAIAWLGKNFTVTENPLYDASPQKNIAGGGKLTWFYYYLYGIERVGMVYGTETLGKNEWYPKGAEFLLDAQKADGHWEAGNPSGDNVYADTCFAILFLRRATKPITRSTGK